MSNTSIHKIEDLKKGDTELLCQLLSLQSGVEPNEAWLRDQAHLITTYPPSLRRPESLLPRLVSALSLTPNKAHLCKTHKPLNAHLIRRIFLQVSAECTTRVARLSEYPMLPESVSQFLKRIQSLNSLWMSPELYRQAFNVMPHEARFKPVFGGCEACILATVGGSPQIISDLRTSMIGRKTKRGPSPRLLPLVEAWIGWSSQRDKICEESDVLAKEVRGIRRQLQLARRQLRRNIAEGIASKEPAAHGGIERDFEGDDKERTNENESIIDFYANVMSTTTLNGPQQTESLHPAFRDSIAFDPESGTFHRTGTEAPKRRPRTAYSESVYDTSTRGAPSRNDTDDPRGYSEDHARAYEELTGHSRPFEIFEDEVEEDEERQRQRQRSRERMTRMSDFL